MTDLTERLAEALDVCNAATAGPWEAEYSRDQGNCVIPHDAKSTLEAVAVTRLYYQQFDAEFIAHARTGYPAALRALQAVLELHWPAKYTGGAGVGYEVGSDGDPCMECNLADREGLTPMVWPCPTVQAITEHLGPTP